MNMMWDIDHCSRCKGVWLDRGEIDRQPKSKAGMKMSINKNTIITMSVEIIDYDDYDDDYSSHSIIINNDKLDLDLKYGS